MSLSKFISLSLVVAVATASPVLKSPSRVLRRDPPAPSAYPLGDACDHEWQYLNFNPSDATDSAHLMTLHNVICSGEMRAVSSYGQASAQSNLKPYARYFPPSDEDDDTQGQVASVLGLIAGTSSTDGAIGAVVGGMVVDNLGKSPSIFRSCNGMSTATCNSRSLETFLAHSKLSENALNYSSTQYQKN